MQNKNYYGLDLLRGIAGYGVAITHYLYFIKNKVFFEYYSFIFVEFFFVLSGFVLSNQLIKIHREKKNIKIFYLRRLFRTIPLYVIALIFYTAISNNFNFEFFKFLFFIQKIFPDFISNNYFMVAWSLSIEEFFYLIFPIYLILFSNIKAAKLGLYFIIVLSIIKILNHDQFTNDFLRTGTFLRLDSIALGFLLNIYFLKLINFKKIILTGIIILLSIIIFYKELLFNNTTLHTLYFIFLSQALSMFVVLFFCTFEFIFKKSYLKKFCSILATQTYSVYLFHLIIMHFLNIANEGIINNLFIYISLLFILSSIIFKYFEKPILQLRPKYKNE